MSTSTDAAEPFLKDSKNGDGETTEDWDYNSPRHRHNVRWLIWLVTGTFMLVFTNATTYFLFGRSNGSLDMTCAAYTSETWSPIIGNVDIKYGTVLFNSTVYGGVDSIYRQAPSREVDMAWNALGGNFAPVILTPEEAAKSNIPHNRVRLQNADGTTGYPVVVEGLHQIHCLNLLRQATYFNHEQYHKWGEGAWKNDEFTLQKHIGHCVDMLRLTLMCTADTGVHPFVWARNSNNASIPPHVFPDFQRNHKCKNFDAIVGYADRRQELWAAKVDILPREDSLILDDWP